MKKTDLGVLSLFSLTLAAGFMSPTIARFAIAYPEVPFVKLGQLITLPTIAGIPFIAISGAVAGKKISYKALSIIGFLMFIVSGSLPYFADSFNLILISRVFVGAGIGLLSPLGNVVAIDIYGQDKSVKYIAYGNLVMSFGCVTLQMLVSVFCDINYKLSLLVHLLGMIPLLLVILFLPKDAANKAVMNSREKAKTKISLSVWGYCILFFVYVILVFPLFLNTSTIVAESGMGESTVSAAIIAMVSVGGIVCGAIYDGIYRKLSDYIFVCALAIGAVGTLIMFTGQSVPVLMMGSLLTGIAYVALTTSVTIKVTSLADVNTIAICSSMVMFSMSIGGFCSNYFNSFLATIHPQNASRFPFLVCAIAYIVFAGLHVIIARKKCEEKAS